MCSLTYLHKQLKLNAMKLSNFHRTIKNKGSLTVIMNSIQYEFKLKEPGITEVKISTKAGINEKLTKELGFACYNWENVYITTFTAKAWNMYENIKNNGNVLLKLKFNEKEYFLEKDEI